MNRERLELLAKRLDLEQSRTDPMENFDMGCWSSGPKAVSAAGVFQASCGTTACAAGLATTVPELRAAGLSLNSGGQIEVRGVINSLYRYDSIGQFFGISVAAAKSLFSPESYDTRGDTEPIHVADRIRELLARETP